MAAIGHLSQGPSGPLPGNEQFPDFCLRSQDPDQHQHQHHQAGTEEHRQLRSHRHSTTSNASAASTDSRLSSSSRASTTPPSPTATDYSYTSPDKSSTRDRNDSTGGSPTPNRSRRDKKELHAARVQKTGTAGGTLVKRESLSKANRLRFSSNSSTPADALAAIEPPHEQGLTRMAFAEQKKWVTVQQKTFTKWCVTPRVGK